MGIDLDGTLLDSNKNISPRNLKALKILEENGIKITIFTGRAWISARDYLKCISNDIPAVFQNGAYVRTTRSNKVLRSVMLDTQIAKRAVEIAKNKGIFTVISQDFTNIPDMKYESSLPLNSKFMPYFERNLYRMEKVKELEIEIPDNGAAGVTWVGKFEVIKKAIKELEDFREKMSVIVDTILGKEAFVELLGRNCGKEVAMNFLLNLFDISPDEAAFIGDSYNDVNVMKAVSHSIAMGNAPDDVKEFATFVTSTNDEDGVANAIYNYILKERELI